MKPTFSSVLFFCMLACLLAGLGWTVVSRRSIHLENTRLKTELNELNQQSRRRELRREQTSLDRQVITRVFRQCRSGEDVPQLGGHRIISNLADSDSVAFYVPDGNHILNVLVKWKQNADDGKAGDQLLSGEQSWSVPLISQRGYHFTVLQSGRKESTIGWKLTCNAEEFQTRSETLSIPPLRAMGASWSSHRTASFPNQMSIQSLLRPPGNRLFTNPVTIDKRTKFGRLADTRLQIDDELTITSDNSPVVSATDAESLLILRKTELLGDYLGDGRYGVKTN